MRSVKFSNLWRQRDWRIVAQTEIGMGEQPSSAGAAGGAVTD